MLKNLNTRIKNDVHFKMKITSIGVLNQNNKHISK